MCVPSSRMPAILYEPRRFQKPSSTSIARWSIMARSYHGAGSDAEPLRRGLSLLHSSRSLERPVHQCVKDLERQRIGVDARRDICIESHTWWRDLDGPYW